MRNLWRLHDSQCAVDERWTSLQLTKDEATGNLFIVETRKEWFPGNAGSQRTCYRKELHFETQAKVPRPEHSLHTPLKSSMDSLEEEEWRSEDHIEQRSNEKIHIGDGPSDATAYTLQECFVRSYNTSCNAFIHLVYEGDNPDSRLQLRVQPMKQEPSVSMWPRDQEACHPHNDLAQLQGVVSPIRPIRGIEWFMDERILVYSLTHMASGQLRPVILVYSILNLIFQALRIAKHIRKMQMAISMHLASQIQVADQKAYYGHRMKIWLGLPRQRKMTPRHLATFSGHAHRCTRR
ncbi:hypothetical protein Focb16_v005995 [Fusarium oxysporum f. sp. cubense]|uniref:Uncharacterized protein n=1 Tax=Fusarium oxysporum f. sp. cubense TaxID=61366 RepID=A0A559LM66_FUSOC|nr:hypothetical protein Focb16_v005995 [Fusarium oxysporum f. sp. cubense]